MTCNRTYLNQQHHVSRRRTWLYADRQGGKMDTWQGLQTDYTSSLFKQHTNMQTAHTQTSVTQRKKEPSVEAYQAPLAFKGENNLRQISGWQETTAEDSEGTSGTQRKPVSSRKHQNCQFIEAVCLFQITHANMNTEIYVWSVSQYETTHINITCKNRTIKNYDPLLKFIFFEVFKFPRNCNMLQKPT